MNLKKIKDTKFFNTMFSFENDLDISKDIEVLIRKNIVIKNIILISNIIYTIIFALVSINEKSNILLTLLFFPLTFLINHTLNKLINKDKNNKTKQEIAMYLCCFYMFLSAILIYVRLKTGINAKYYGEVGYILVYYSLIICSFYQDKKLLLTVYKWLLVIITIIHFTLTYNIVFDYNNKTFSEFFLNFFTSLEFKDILLRTILLLIFMLVLYLSVQMSSFMQRERKTELTKRKELEDNYKNIVLNIYKTNVLNKIREDNVIKDAPLIKEISLKLANLYGLSDNELAVINNFSMIHLDNNLNLEDELNLDTITNFSKLKDITNKALTIINRVNLEQKCQDIIRVELDGASSKDFALKMLDDNIVNNIILLSDTYVSLRSIRNYKRSFTHNITMKYLKENFRIYFNQTILERFIRFEDDFEMLYNNFEFKEIL